MWFSSNSAEWRSWKRSFIAFSSAGRSVRPYVAWMLSPRTRGVG
jgi:hypothetical protein